MTRANFEIICGYPKKHYFEKGSDGYPESVLPEIFELIKDVSRKVAGEILFWGEPDGMALSKFIEELNLGLVLVGNFCYYYQIDFGKQTIKAWDSGLRWVNAPDNWKERGWNCYIGKNGKYGYDTWIKGKLLVNITFSEVVTNKLEINQAKLKQLLPTNV